MSTPLRIGLLRLADSLPVLMARELGLFEQAGITAEIVVEPSWANIADGLSWGRLDAAVVFPPLAIMTYLGKRGRPTPMRVVANLSYGGNTIVLRNGALTTKAEPRLAVVHAHSTHFLLLRHFLLTHCPAALDQLVIMPPDRMLDALANGTIDGFCAGPPWGAAAEDARLGHIVSGSVTIRPGHLEKQFVVTETWTERYPDQAVKLESILAASITRCLDPAKQKAITDVLTRPLVDGGFALPSQAVRTTMPGSDYPHNFELTPRHGTSIDWIIAEMRTLGWISPEEQLRPWTASY
ncbi:ABC transporter substrate-binding protein [Asaia prunellae]|uniref:ABC transporter substrate-binding protein n=1 Tax=Asaia prunellae TaxID=610245 RepID=UPI00046E8A9A|nr:ABC transporter substrate-binding protein [Asaia prunellae]